jgi:hypothetical protein
VCARERKRESPRINQIGLLLARVSKEYNIINPGRRALSLERAAVARISVVNLPLLLNAHFKILMGAPGASLSPAVNAPQMPSLWLASKQISSLAQPAWNHYHVAAGKRKMNESHRNNGEGVALASAALFKSKEIKSKN